MNQTIFLFTHRCIIYTSLILIISSSLLAQSDWTWRNPWPAEYGLSSLVWTGEKYVGVGGGGVVATSFNGSEWEVQRLAATMWSIAWNGNLLVAVGNGGRIFTSEDGKTWTGGVPEGYIAGGNTDALRSIIWTGSQFVAVGNGRDTTLQGAIGYRYVVLTSPDGMDWTYRDIGQAKSYLFDVAWSGDRLVAVGWYEVILSSPDGVDWTKQHESDDISRHLNSVAWAGPPFGLGSGQFVVTGEFESNELLFTSDDGLSWARDTSGLNLYSLHWTGSPDSGGFGLVAGGADGLYASPDAESWTLLSDSVNGRTVVWTGEQMVLGTYQTSPDGVNWTNHGGEVTPWELNAVTWVPGMGAVAVGYWKSIVTSPDGVHWTRRGETGPGVEFTSVAGGPGKGFVAVGQSSEDSWEGKYGGAIFYSSDGVTWSKIESGRTSLESVVWAGNKFVAAGYGDTVYVSNDGIQWTKQNKGYPSTFFGMTWTGEQIIAVGQAGAILTSPNGVEWAIQDSGADGHLLYDVTWSGSTSDSGVGRLVAVGINGEVRTSTDGIVWTDQISGSNEILRSVASSGPNGRWVVATANRNATSSNGNVYASSDGGVTWQAFSILTLKALRGVTWAGDKYITVGYQGNILTAPDDGYVVVNTPSFQQVNQLSIRVEREILHYSLSQDLWSSAISPKARFVVYLLSGKKVFSSQQQLGGNTGRLFIGHLSPGHYLLRILIGGERYSKSFALFQ